MTSSSSWEIPYGEVTDLEKSPSEIFEDYLRNNWSLQHPAVYWKYWDGYHDHTIKVVEDSLIADPLVNEWSFFSYRDIVNIHVFGRTAKLADAMPPGLIAVRQHLENLIKSRPDALQNDGIFSIRYLRSLQGAGPDEAVNASSSHRVFHIIMQVELLCSKRVRVITE